MKTKTHLALLLGGVFAASAAMAQTSVMGASSVREVPSANASVTANVPPKAGEASTMTNGVPNQATHNPVTSDGRSVYPFPLQVSEVPSQAGEASTMVGGNPNADPNSPLLRR